MAMLLPSKDEIYSIYECIEILKVRIQFNTFNDDDRKKAHDIFSRAISYLKITNILDVNKEKKDSFVFYRARKGISSEINNIEGLIFPPKDKCRLGRMNYEKQQILYTSLNEYTALLETEIETAEYFQLTRFLLVDQIRYYYLGNFSEVFLNFYRDSNFTKEQCKEWFGDPEASSSSLERLSELEHSLLSVFYGEFHQLSSILSNVILNQNNVDAIAYPTVKNKFGINFAFTLEGYKKLSPVYTSFNKIIEKRLSGFFKYKTLKDSFIKDSVNLDYNDIKENAQYR